LFVSLFGPCPRTQVRSEKDHEGFFEHFDVAGFLHQNRFKTLIAAIPGLKRTSRIPSDTAKVQHFDLPVHRAAAAAGGNYAQANQMVPFGGFGATANPYMSMSMMNPMMSGMGAMGGMGGMGAMGGFPQSMMSPWGAATMPAAGAGAAKPAKVKRTPSRAASASSSSSSSAALASGGSLDGDDNGEDDSMFASEEATEDVQFGIRFVSESFNAQQMIHCNP
jgi:hypothetical protein